jgi:hypothetical protein
MPDLTSPPTTATLRRALESYADVIARQGVAKLAERDRWYHEELPRSIASRSPAHITIDELARATEWKMSRGDWRARNLVLVRGNEPEAVIELSTDALSKIPHPTKPISTLAKLAGVGPATASSVVAAAAPDFYPFFDELVAAQLPELGKVAWTLGYYARYAEALRARVRELGGDWTPVKLERALWALAGGKAGASG